MVQADSHNGSTCSLAIIIETQSMGARTAPPAENDNGTLEITTTGSIREIWLASQQCLEASCAYNESFTIQLHGTVDFDILRKTLIDVAADHDAFSVTFSNDGTVMRKLQAVPIPDIQVHDVRTSITSKDERFLQNLIDKGASTPFDLEHGPLWRAHIVALSDRNAALIFFVHHIVCDGWSLNILVRDIGTTYDLLRSGHNVHKEKQASFFEFVRNYTEPTSVSRRQEVVDFWKNHLTQPLPVLDLPADYPRPLRRTFKARSKRSRIDPALAGEIKKLATDNGCTPFSYFLAAYYCLLLTLTGSDDIIVGIPVAGQSFYMHPDLVGHCVSLLPIRMAISPDKSFEACAGTIMETLLNVYDHHEVSFGDLLHELHLPRDPSRLPLVSAGFTYTKMPSCGEFGFEQCDAECIVNSRTSEIFELYATVLDHDNDIELLWHCNSDLFSDTTAQRWIDEYVVLLNGICNNPSTPLYTLPVLTETERLTLLETLNATDKIFNPAETVVAMFEKQVACTPDAIALEFQGESMTYQQLNHKSQLLATYIQSLGPAPGTPVAFCLERSFEMVISLLGILKAGAAYIPIDPSFPDDRIKFIIQDSQAGLFITSPEIGKRFSDLAITLVAPSEIPDVPEQHHSPVLSGAHLAYIIYTSGSTGKPKGVEIRHFSLANFINTMRETPGMNSTDSLLAITTISFDIAGLELLCPLTCGARIYLAEKALASDPVRLGDFINEKRPTIMQATPATWTMLLDSGWTHATRMTLLCGGEALTRVLADRLLATEATVWNMYGPTETTIWASVWNVVPGKITPPVGKPVANTRFYILDSHLRPVPTGASGDLYIGGIGLARGYCNRPELTSEKFIGNPFCKHLYSGLENRLYKTGDIARWRNDGTVEVSGRSDFQVKIRGFRIETGEIEAVLLHHPVVKECVVTVGTDAQGNKILIAYTVFHEGQDATIDNLRTTLRTSLPEYMLPSRFVQLQALPRLTNNKIDRASLPQPPTEQPGDPGDTALPSSPIEKKLMAVWKEVLDLGNICIDDNFFDIGGHSLLAVQIINEIHKKYSIRLPLAVLIEYPTIRLFSAYLQQLIPTPVTDITTEPANDSSSAAIPVKGLRLGYTCHGQPAWFVADPNNSGTFTPLEQSTSVSSDPFSVPQKTIPVVPAQHEIWKMIQADNDSSIRFNDTITLSLSGQQIDNHALYNAIQGLAAIHECLRGRFSTDGNYLLIEPQVEIPILRQYTDLPDSNEAAVITTAIEKDHCNHHFDLRTGPLTRVTILDITKTSSTIFLTVHSSIIDRWSLHILAQDLFRLYASFAVLAPPCALPSQGFSDYVASRSTTGYTSQYQKSLLYWHSRFALPPLPNPAPSLFNTVSPASTMKTFNTFNAIAQIAGEDFSNITLFARNNNVSLFAVLLAGFAMQLRDRSGSGDIITGVTFAGQFYSAFTDITGQLARVLPIRVSAETAIPFSDLCRICHNLILNAGCNAAAGIEEISKEMGLTPQRVQSLMETRLTFIPATGDASFPSGALHTSYLYHPRRESDVPLELFIRVSTASLELSACCSTGCTSQEWLASCVDDLADLLVDKCKGNVIAGTTDSKPSAPENEYEQFLADIWHRILYIPEPDLNSGFFALGGDSLSAVNMVHAIANKYHLLLPLSMLTEHTTIRKLAVYLRNECSSVHHEDLINKKDGALSRKQLWNTIVPFRREGTLPPFFLVSGLGGNPMIFLNLSRALNKNQPFYALQYRGVDGILAPHTTVEDIAAEFLADMQRVQPEGPYFIGGYSFGGLVAYEMVHELLKKGQQVGGLILIDTVIPARYKKPFRKIMYKRVKGLIKALVITAHKSIKQRISSDDALLPGKLTHECFRKRFDMVGKCNTAAGIHYKPCPINVNVVYIKSARTIPAHQFNQEAVVYRPVQEWFTLVPPERIIERTINTHHFDLLNEPHVRETAKNITEGLVSLRAQAPAVLRR